MEIRNLCDECSKCEDRNKGLSYCFDVCSCGIDILEQIENIRNHGIVMGLEQMAGYYTALREICNMRNESKYPEYLEDEIDVYLEERGMR